MGHKLEIMVLLQTNVNTNENVLFNMFIKNRLVYCSLLFKRYVFSIVAFFVFIKIKHGFLLFHYKACYNIF